MDLQVTETENTVEVRGDAYTWRLERGTESFTLIDHRDRPIAHGGVQPAVEVMDADGQTRADAGRLAAVDVSAAEDAAARAASVQLEQLSPLFVKGQARLADGQDVVLRQLLAQSPDPGKNQGHE